MDLTTIVGIRSFMGAPIILKNGDYFGTLFAVDTKPYQFTIEHASLFRLVITSLSYVLELEKQLITDLLTGAYTRNYLKSYFKKWSMEKSRDRNTNLAILFFDFDGFKKVNDSYGHETGDQLLIEMVKRIKTHLENEEDFLTRMGGDEFVAAIHYNDIKEVEGIGRKILNSISSPCVIHEHKVKITCSIGVSLYRDGDTLVNLIKRADVNMYKVKNSGKNNIFVCTSEDA